MAPEYPSAINASLLQTGQPTAKKDSSAPALPIFSCLGFSSEKSFFTYVAVNSPVRIDEITITVTDQLVTAISRPKIGFSTTAVGNAITKYVRTPTLIATTHLLVLQVSSEVKQLGTFSPQ